MKFLVMVGAALALTCCTAYPQWLCKETLDLNGDDAVCIGGVIPLDLSGAVPVMPGEKFREPPPFDTTAAPN